MLGPKKTLARVLYCAKVRRVSQDIKIGYLSYYSVPLAVGLKTCFRLAQVPGRGEPLRRGFWPKLPLDLGSRPARGRFRRRRRNRLVCPVFFVRACRPSLHSTNSSKNLAKIQCWKTRFV